MELSLDEQIKNLKWISDEIILGHYEVSFTKAIATLLKKLGYKENEEYFFNNERKRKSYLTSPETEDIISISYFFNPSSEKINLGVTFNDGDPEFPINYYSNYNVKLSLTWYSQIYNYLRTEWNSSKNKSKK